MKMRGSSDVVVFKGCAVVICALVVAIRVVGDSSVIVVCPGIVDGAGVVVTGE